MVGGDVVVLGDGKFCDDHNPTRAALGGRAVDVTALQLMGEGVKSGVSLVVGLLAKNDVIIAEQVMKKPHNFLKPPSRRPGLVEAEASKVDGNDFGGGEEGGRWGGGGVTTSASGTSVVGAATAVAVTGAGGSGSGGGRGVG